MVMPSDLLMDSLLRTPPGKGEREAEGENTPLSVKGKKLIEYMDALRPKIQLLRQIALENDLAAASFRQLNNQFRKGAK